MKKLLAVCTVAALLLCLAVPAMASGEASGNSNVAPAVQNYDVSVVAQSAAISIVGGELASDPEAAICLSDASGEISADNLSGIYVEYTGIGDWDGSTAFGHSGIVLAGEGDVYIGGSDDYLVQEGVSELYGDRAYFNSAIILGNEDADEENALGGNTRDYKDASEGNEGTGIYADAENVYIDNVMISTAGYGRSGIRLTSNVQKAVISNSSITAVGSNGTGSSAPGFIMMYASSRPVLIESSGDTYFYNDELYSADWGVYSLDGCYGANVYIIDCYSINYVGGYSAYALGFAEGQENSAYFYGSYAASAQYGTILCAAGRTYTGAIYDAPEEALAEVGDTYIYDTVLPSGWSYIGGNTNAVTMQADMSGAEIVGILDSTHTIFDTAAVSTEDHIALDDTMDLYNYLDDMNVGASYFFLNHIHGSAIAVRSENVDITLDDCIVTASNGVAIQTVVGYDTGAANIKVADGTEYHGSDITIKNMSLAGDILHEDYQRKMVLSLENAYLEGAVVSGTWAGWEQAIYDEIEADWNDDCDELGIDADAVQETLAYDDSYETVWGVRMSIDGSSEWVVDGDSTLYSLAVEDGAVIEAPEGMSLQIYVDCEMNNSDLSYDYTTGTQVTELTPGTYTGVVILVG